jgi:hypothetical protein
MCQEPNKGQCAAQKIGFLHWRKKKYFNFHFINHSFAITGEKIMILMSTKNRDIST